jgi:hypothetical protein
MLKTGKEDYQIFESPPSISLLRNFRPDAYPAYYITVCSSDSPVTIELNIYGIQKHRTASELQNANKHYQNARVWV